MLQRAASNAYSWWWASNIRTKQSKWLDNNLQEMEEKVKAMIKLIDEDAESFAKRAEMYYKRRPELINFVQETYRAYKALADRYDHISGELHKANHTLATAFPDQVQLMHDDEDGGSVDATKLHKPPGEIHDLSSKIKNCANRAAVRKLRPRSHNSAIDKDKAQEEIDRLQKEILVLQTEKEFVKCSYESGLAKYLDIEKQVTEMQEEVSSLQDEFSASAVIEDDEARALMAATALKSCEDTLVHLQEQQNKYMEEARIESERIRGAKMKLKALKVECGRSEVEPGEICDRTSDASSIITNMEEDVCGLNERLELQSICEKVKEHLEMSSDTSVVELAEKIDELVDKVIGLELTVSSQTALIDRLRSETDELQKHLQVLEEDKTVLIDDSNILSEKLKEAEEELHRIQDLEKSVHDEKGMLKTHFTEACHSLNDLSEKLQSPTRRDNADIAGSAQEGENFLLNHEPIAGNKVKDETMKYTKDNPSEVEAHGVQGAGPCLPEAVSQSPVDSEKVCETKQEDEVRKSCSSRTTDDICHSIGSLAQLEADEDTLDLHHVFINGVEGQEKFYLDEYASVLQNYRETKKRLSEVEKKSQDSLFETISQIKELRSANARKDEELQSLREKLSTLQTTSIPNAEKRPPEVSHASECKTRMRTLFSIMSEDEVALKSKKSHGQDAKSKARTNTLDVSDSDIDIKSCQVKEPQPSSAAEDKFRRDIDTLLEENLDFWLRFCTSYHQIQKFKVTFGEVEVEMDKLNDVKAKEGGNGSALEQAVQPSSAPIDRKLRELNTELQVWMEQNSLLKGELQCRFSSLCSIQEDICRVPKSSEAEGDQFTPFQAAKFLGEVLNMKQENNKVASELQAGLDHARGLQAEVGRALSRLNESFELSGSRGHHHNLKHFSTKSRIPLRTFLFGNAKPKKPSIFSCMNPAMRKHYSGLKPGLPP